MTCKKINLSLLGVVAILFMIAILVFIKVLFSEAKGFEWGSVTDWISSFANLLMASAAIYAAWNAKDWIRDKKNVEGFEHITSMMADYDEIVLTLQELHPSILIIQRGDGKFDSLYQEIHKQAYRIIGLQSKLSSSKRWGVSEKQDVTVLFKELISFYDTAFYLFGSLRIGDSSKSDSLKEQLSRIHSTILANKEIMQDDIGELFNFKNIK